MAGAHTMQPNHRIAGPDLRVHRNALVVPLDATRRKSEGLDEKVVRRGYVLVYKKIYQSINFRHVLPFSLFVPYPSVRVKRL